ncbi:MAG: hypothetical protein ACRD6X_20200 [Pyrinomonadaceae bacterium]
MNATLTIDLPEDVRTTLGKAAKEAGVSEKAFAAQALKDYFFLQRFRSLRERMIAESKSSYSDEDVFGLIS